jgi:integrase
VYRTLALLGCLVLPQKGSTNGWCYRSGEDAMPKNPKAKKRFTFTGDKLRALPIPPEGRASYYDDVVRGLMLEVTANGAKSFRVYRKFRGRPVKITCGPFDPNLPETRELPEGAKPLDLLGNHPSLNVRMARKLALAVVSELDAGVNPAETHTRKGITLGEVFGRYRAHLTAEGKKTVPAIVWHWQRYLGELPDTPRKKHGAEREKAPGGVNWQRRAVADISRADVSRLRLDLAENIGRTTANRVTELLRAMLNFARKHDLYEGQNPAEDAGKFDVPSRERFLQPHEAVDFFKALSEEDDRDFADYVRLLLFTGARRGNVLKMRWDEISLEGALWTISGEKMKNGDPLTIPLPRQAVDVLRRRAETANGNEWVFPGETPAGHAGPFRAQWSRFVKKAKVPDLHVHDLRRSLGSWMAAVGSSTVITARALGHRSLSMATVYQRLVAGPVREAMQKAVTAMEDAAKEKPGQVVPMPKGRKARGGGK